MSKIVVSKGEVSSGLVIGYGDQLEVQSGGTIKNTTVNSRGTATISAGGVMKDTTINTSGNVTASGASIKGTTIVQGTLARLLVYDGGTVEYAEVKDGGTMNVRSVEGNIAIVSSALIESGNVALYGGNMNDTVINGGSQAINSGNEIAGIASDTIVNSAGTQTVGGGGTASNTTVNDGGTQTVSLFGLAENTQVNSGGLLQLDRGTAVSACVAAGGSVKVNNDGSLENSVIESGASLHVSSGGILSGDADKIYGSLILDAGAVIDTFVGVFGDVTVNGDIQVSENVGVYLWLENGEPESALLHGLEKMSDPSKVYITVTGGIPDGTYAVADGVSASYEGSLSIWNASWETPDVSVQIGGESVTSDGITYTLVNDNGTVYVTVKNESSYDYEISDWTDISVNEKEADVSIPYDGRYSFSKFEGTNFSGTLEFLKDGQSVLKVNVAQGYVEKNDLLLDKGDYTLHIISKTGPFSGDISAHLIGTEIFYRSNLYNDDDMQKLTDPETWISVGSEESGTVQESIVSYNGSMEFVGYHDLVDWRQFTLENAGSYTFSLDLKQYEDPEKDNADKALTVTLYAVKGNSISQVKSVKVSGLSAEEVLISNTLLAAGSYYIKVASVNGSKGYGTDYDINLSGYAFANAENGNAAALTAENALILDQAVSGEVSFGCPKEFFTLTAEKNGLYSLALENDLLKTFGSNQGLTVTVWSMNSTKTSLSKVASYNIKGAWEEFSSSSFFLTRGTYYVSVEAQGAKTCNDVFYSVTASCDEAYQPTGISIPNFMDTGDPLKLTDKDITICSAYYCGYGDDIHWIALSAENDEKSLPISGGKYDFNIENSGTGAASVTLYQLKDGQSVQKLKTVSVAAGQSAQIAGQSLSADSVYFLQFDGSAAAKKNAYASLSITTTAHAYTPVNADDLIENLPEQFIAVRPATGSTTILCSDEFIGDGDAVDYRMITLSESGNYTFTLKTGDANSNLVLTVWTPSADGTKLTKVQSKTGTSLSMTTSLNAGTCYVSVASAKSKPAGLYADYELTLGTNKISSTPDDHYFANLGSEYVKTFTLEKSGLPVSEASLTFSGTADAGTASCRKITVQENGWYTFTYSADAKDSYKLYTLTSGTNNLKQVSGFSLTGADKKNTKTLFLAAGDYYGIAVASGKDYSIAAEGYAYTETDNADDLPVFVNDTYRVSYSGGPVSLFGENFVGYGDSIDWRMFTSGLAGEYTFDLTVLQQGTAAPVLTVYSMNAAGNALTKIKSASGKITLNLAADTAYYVSVADPKASSGNFACYSVNVSGPELVSNSVENHADYASLYAGQYISAATGNRSFEDQHVLSASLAAGESAYCGYVVTTAGSFTFDLESSDKSMLTLYTLKADGTALVKKAASGTSFTVWLEEGTYYLGTYSAGGADVSVTASATLYTDPNSSDDIFYDLPAKYQSIVGNQDSTQICKDEFLGATDAVDSRKITLLYDGYYNLNLVSENRTANLTVTLWQWNAAGSALTKAGTFSLSASAAADSASMKKDLLLTAGEYYVTTSAANTAKGAFAEYELFFTASEVFDHSDISAADDTVSGARELTSGGFKNGYVGCGDSVDYFKLSGFSSGMYQFTANVDDGSSGLKFTIYYYNESANSLTAISTLNKAGTTKTLYLDDDKVYYCMVQASDTKQAAEYSIDISRNEAVSLAIEPCRDSSIDLENVPAGQSALVSFDITPEMAAQTCSFDYGSCGFMTLWKLDEAKGSVAQVKCLSGGSTALAEGSYCMELAASVVENSYKVSFNGTDKVVTWSLA